MSPLMPTHECFNDAIEFVLEELQHDNDKALAYRVVHAVCLNPHTNEPFAHAWVEGVSLEPECDDAIVEGMLLDGVRVWVASPRAQLYEDLRPQKILRYTPAEWMEQNEKSVHYGPWDAEIAALCKDPKELKRVWTRKPSAT